MNKKALFYIGFFAALVLAFLWIMGSITDMGKPKLPPLSTVQPFRFTRQDGMVVTEKDVKGKVYVAEYFFTTCKGICPKMNRNMAGIHKALAGEKDFLILSHTVDPETDSVAKLKSYADSLGADPANWWFLTGSKADLYKAARESYLLDDPKNNSKSISEQFLHTQFFALVDRNGVVRGIYDGLKPDELKQLENDAHILISQ